MAKVSAIILNYNTAQMTEKAVRRLLASEKGIEWQVMLIDNGSAEELPRKNFAPLGIEPIYNKDNLGFARAVNEGIGRADGDYILLLNSDVLLEDGCIGALIAELKGDIAIAGPRMSYPDGRFQASFGKFPAFWSEFMRFSLLYKIFPGGTFAVNSIFKKIKTDKAYPVDWVSGACMLFKKELIGKIGMLDTAYFFGVEDIDFCYRAKQNGYKTLYCPQQNAVHYHGLSSGGTRSLRRIANDRDGFDYFFRKNFPDKKITRALVRWMHEVKIAAIKIFK